MLHQESQHNVQKAFEMYRLWLSWYPKDQKGALEFAHDMIDTVGEFDQFAKLIKETETKDI